MVLADFPNFFDNSDKDNDNNSDNNNDNNSTNSNDNDSNNNRTDRNKQWHVRLRRAITLCVGKRPNDRRHKS